MATRVFRWETELERDARLPQLQRLVEQILRANFPTVADKLRKDEPPARRYEPPAPAPSVPAASVTGPAPEAPDAAPEPETDALGRVVLQLHGYSSESSEADSTRTVDPMDELSDFEPQSSPRESSSSSRRRNQQPPREDGDHEMEDADADADVRPAAAAMSGGGEKLMGEWECLYGSSWEKRWRRRRRASCAAARRTRSRRCCATSAMTVRVAAALVET